MTLSTPRWYFDTFVLPPYTDFLADRLSRHKAASAINATYHFWERLYKYYKNNKPEYLYGTNGKSNFYSYLLSRCPNLNNINRCSRALKHQEITVETQLFTATGVVSYPTTVSAAAIFPHGMTVSSSDVTVPGGHELKVSFLENTTVATLVGSVIDFWQAWLEDHPTE